MTMMRKILFALLLAACHHVAHAATPCGNFPGMRECTDTDFNPYAALMKKAPLFVEAIRSVGHVCDRVDTVYLDNMPGVDYYHVTCMGQLRYTIGVSKARVVVWAGNFTNY